MADQAPADPGDEAADDPLAITFDENFVRGASVQEPSARARMLANRQPFDQPDGFPTWPPPDAAFPASTRGRPRFARRLVAALVIFAVIGGGYTAYCERQVTTPQAPVPNAPAGSTGDTGP